jgi:predicted MPP superfamily phosphohydrolase
LVVLEPAGLVAITADASLIETHPVVVERAEIRLARLPNELDRLTIAHLSDFHYVSSYDAEVIRAAVRVVNELNPDLVILTGDYVTVPIFGSGVSAARAAKPCAQILSELRAPMGTFAILGNHDQCNPQFITRSLEAEGIAVLRNYPLYVERAGTHLWIAGVDDVLEGKARLDQSLHPIPVARPPCCSLMNQTMRVL